MAINKNHEFEELDGIKCAIVEKNVPAERVEFLKKLLEFNKYTVVVVPSPAPKVAAKAAPVKPAIVPAVAPVTAAGEKATPTASENPVPAQAENKAAESVPPATFTVGVTTLKFNPVNAVFGRLLHTPDGHVVTLAYWHQKEVVSHDEIPYFEDI